MATTPNGSTWSQAYGSEGGEPDPIQGMDVEVFVRDPGQNKVEGNGVEDRVLLGSFTSIVFTFRVATEPYITFNQRIHRLLDGDIQIAFVLEKGEIDLAAHVQTFGHRKMGRGRRINRSPRYTIEYRVDTNGELPVQFTEWYLAENAGRRMTDGIIELSRCKMDSLHTAQNAGKSAGVNQWQGLAEGIDLLPLNQITVSSPTILASGQGLSANTRAPLKDGTPIYNYGLE